MKTISLIFTSAMVVFFFCSADMSSHRYMHEKVSLSDEQASKAFMIQTLRDLHSLLLDSNYIEAKDYFLHTENMDKKTSKEAFSHMLEMKELSASGIDSLEKHAIFGKVLDLYGQTGIRGIKKHDDGFPNSPKLNPDNCYGLYIPLTIIEVMAVWDGKGYKFFRLDNVGKLDHRGFDK